MLRPSPGISPRRRPTTGCGRQPVEVVAQLAGPGASHTFDVVEFGDRCVKQTLEIVEVLDERVLDRVGKPGQPVEDPAAPGRA